VVADPASEQTDLDPAAERCLSECADLVMEILERRREARRLRSAIACRGKNEGPGGRAAKERTEPSSLDPLFENGPVPMFADDRKSFQSMRKASDSALRRLLRERTVMLDALPAQVALVDAEGRIIATNRSWSEFSDACYRPPSGAAIHDAYAWVPPTACGEMAPLALQGLRAVLAGERTETGFEYACDGHGPDGRSDGLDRRWFRFSVTAIDPMRRAGAVVMHIDITDTKRAQEEIERARIRAEEANRTKSEFLANMSHELRTPLNAIIGFSEIMKEKMFGPLGAACYRDYAADIHSSGTHLLSLVNDILDVSRVDIGRLELRTEPIEAPAVIRSCAALVGGRATEADVALSIELEKDLPPLLADIVRLKQILVNLLSNAIKFTPAGGRVRIAAARARNTPIGDAVAIEIVDTGIGMTEEQLRIALQPFRQADNSLARLHDGAGLGLPLAKGLVELHGGRLEIESRLGQGTRARVLLPIAGESPVAETDDRAVALAERVA
jgi:signal transduction histidine kinase